jgi:hypothetical protein
MKKNLLSLFAVVIAIAFSAFSTNRSSSLSEDYYYGFNDEIDKYVLLEGVTNPSTVEEFCVLGQQFCIKKLTTDGDAPLEASIQEAASWPSISDHQTAFDFEAYEDQ